MWKQVWDHFRAVILLTERVEAHDADIKELRQELKEVRDEIREIHRSLDALLAGIQHLRTELEHERRHAADEHATLILRLDNTLLRFERRLPAASDEPTGE
jgi:chromosome segregation ATPase